MLDKFGIAHQQQVQSQVNTKIMGVDQCGDVIVVGDIVNAVTGNMCERTHNRLR